MNSLLEVFHLRGDQMTEERAKRKMSAILSADVKGYSRLMSEDEEGTVKTLCWLEGDKIWIQFQKLTGGLAFCRTILRNPRGTPEGNNQYISFNDVNWSRFSRVK
jgi:hypothetical protein